MAVQSMAQHSKYSDAQIETITGNFISVLKKHDTPVDLALIALGNMASHLLLTGVPVSQREHLAQVFANSLIKSVSIKNKK